MRTSFRQARPQDFEYCAKLYFAGMERIIREFKLDVDKQVPNFRMRWELTQVRIITLDHTDVGWLQSETQDDGVFLGQLFVDGPYQRQGIGTEVVLQIIREAAHARQSVKLGVVKTNPALRLYERLGFRITHEDERKFYMRRDAAT
jgi:ribosomal protein S18 acetylase RimI-like enzyme